MDCGMHNPSEAPQAAYLAELPSGYNVPLCTDCCAWWRAEDAAGRHDAPERLVRVQSVH